MNADDRERLFAAYRRTAFQVRAPGGSLTLRVGQTHAELDDLLAAHQARSWAYLTACNPGSVRLIDGENARRQSALADAVSRFGLPAFEGEGVGDDGRWPPEPSLLVVGITKEAALDLGRRFGQAAIVFGERDSAAELLDCSPSSDEHHSRDGRDVES